MSSQLEDSQDFIGEDARLCFYQNYKKFDKIKQILDYEKDHETNGILGILDNQYVNEVLPKGFGLLKQQGDNSQLKNRNGFVSKRELPCLSNMLKVMHQIKELDFSYCQMESLQAQHLLQNLSQEALEFNLEGNNIGMIGCRQLSKILGSPDYKLKILNLENNNLGASECQVIFNALVNQSNYRLKSLNLSKNFVNDDICKTIMDLLVKNKTMVELYLHWNKICGAGGQLIAQGMLQNNTLKVLDLSWNQIGNFQTGIQSFCKLIMCKENPLLHFDLSFNKFTIQESYMIKYALENNNNIFGFHFEGNFGYIDSKGFLIITEDDKAKSKYLQYYDYPITQIRRINGVKAVKRKNYYCDEKDYRDCCWICEGWKEVKIEITENQDNDNESQDQQLFTTKKQFLRKVIPPEQVKFFLSVLNKNFGQNSVNQQQSTQTKSNQTLNSLPSVRNISRSPYKKLSSKIISVQEQNGGNQQQGQQQKWLIKGSPLLKQTIDNTQSSKRQLFQNINNNNNIQDNQELINSQLYLPNIKVKPRTIDMKFVITGTILRPNNNSIDKNEIDTKFGSSENLLEKDKKSFSSEIPQLPNVFADYHQDNNALINQCFNSDIENSNIKKYMEQKLTKLEKQQVLETLKKNYKILKFIYQFLSTIQPQGSIICIQQKVFLEFLIQIKVIKNDISQINIYDIIITTIFGSTISNIRQNSQGGGVNQQNINSLVSNNQNQKLIFRQQFLEILIRITEEFLYKTGLFPSILQGIEWVIKKMQVFYTNNCFAIKEFRQQQLFSKECNFVFNYYKNQLTQIYNKYINTKIVVQLNKYSVSGLLLDEFKQIFIDSLSKETINKEFEIQMNQAFIYSQITTIDDSASYQQFQIGYVEFLEALSRIADQLQLPPLGQKLQFVLTEDTKINIPLPLKIEALIFQLLHNNKNRINGKEKSIFSYAIETYGLPVEIVPLISREEFQNFMLSELASIPSKQAFPQQETKILKRAQSVKQQKIKQKRTNLRKNVSLPKIDKRVIDENKQIINNSFSNKKKKKKFRSQSQGKEIANKKNEIKLTSLKNDAQYMANNNQQQELEQIREERQHTFSEQQMPAVQHKTESIIDNQSKLRNNEIPLFIKTKQNDNTN